MGLRDIDYKEDYRSGYNDIVAELLRPSLEVSSEYWRAVGYFSSSSLEAFGAPLGTFIKNGGNIRLVTSVELSARDLQAIKEGAVRKDVCESRLKAIVDEQFADGMGDGVARLCTLIKIGRMKILIAVPKTGTGVYHEKIGVFHDEQDYVAFTGSSNESLNSYENNRECIDVYPSWLSHSRAERKRKHFEDLWNRNDLGVEVYTFPEAVENKLLRISEQKKTWSYQHRSEKNEDKWRHQEEALQDFLKAERGILNMATGTGKTRTALKVISNLVETEKIDKVIVAMDGVDLLDQWRGELLTLRRHLPVNFKVFRDYSDYKDVQNFVLDPFRSILLVSRRQGVSRDPLTAALSSLNTVQANRTLLIHDEVHNLGSPLSCKRLSGLSNGIRFRLGLSATPEREYDGDGNAFIEEHIGPVVSRFGLEDAIRRGILTQFSYYPLEYEPAPEDKERVRAIYRKQYARAKSGDPMSDEEVWIEVANVYKTSLAKLPVFSNFIAQHKDLLERCIIFVETQEFGANVLDIVHEYRPDFHSYFTGEQQDTLKRFASGDLECLVTCHRVSEGIDIRSLNTVILLSSARARLETIQRMGRCLRIDPDNPKKTANIVDFIRKTEDDSDGFPNVDEERRNWLIELSKVKVESK